MHDLRLCRVGISDSVRRASPSWNNRRAGATSAGQRLPWFCVFTSERLTCTYTSCAASYAVNCVALIIYSLFDFIHRIYLPS